MKTTLELANQKNNLSSKSATLHLSPKQKGVSNQALSVAQKTMDNPSHPGLSGQLAQSEEEVKKQLASLTADTGSKTNLAMNEGHNAAEENPSIEADTDDKNAGDLEKDPYKSMNSKTGLGHETDPIKVFFEQLLNMLLKIGPIIKATQQHSHNLKTERHNKVVSKIEQLDEFESGVGQSLAKIAKDKNSYNHIKEDIDNGSNLTNALVNNKQLNTLLTRQKPELTDQPLTTAQKKHNALADTRSNYSNQIQREMYKNSEFKENFAACSPMEQQQALDKFAAHIDEKITTPRELSKKDVKDAKSFVKDLTKELKESAAVKSTHEAIEQNKDKKAATNAAQLPNPSPTNPLTNTPLTSAQKIASKNVEEGKKIRPPSTPSSTKTQKLKPGSELK